MKLLRPKQACELLNISYVTMQQLVESGTLQATRLGPKSLRIYEDSVAELIKNSDYEPPLLRAQGRIITSLSKVILNEDKETAHDLYKVLLWSSALARAVRRKEDTELAASQIKKYLGEFLAKCPQYATNIDVALIFNIVEKHLDKGKN